MKEPTKPYPPFDYQYEARTERRYIYKYSASLRDDDDDDDEKEVDLSLPKKEIFEVNLAWLLKQIPKGLTPKDVKIEFYYNANYMAYEDHHTNFYYEVKIPTQKVAYKTAMEKYKKDLKQYEKDLIKYKEYCKDIEILESIRKKRKHITKKSRKC